MPRGVPPEPERSRRSRGVEWPRAVPRPLPPAAPAGCHRPAPRRRGCPHVDEPRCSQPDGARRRAAAPARVPAAVPARRDHARLFRGRDRHSHERPDGGVASRLRHARVSQHGADPGRDRPFHAGRADVHRQRAWSVDSQGGPAAVGRRRSEPGRRRQDHPAQSAAPDCGDSRSRSPGRAHYGLERRTGLRSCRARSPRRPPIWPRRGRAGRRRSPPTPSRSCTQGLRALPPCTTSSRESFRRCSGTHREIRTRSATCES